MRTLLFVITAVAVGFASLAVVPRVQPVTMATCTDEVAQVVRGKVTLAIDKKITDRRLQGALRPLCREIVKLARVDAAEEEVRPALTRLVTSRPQSWVGVCRVLTDADLAAHTHLLRFVTRAERQRYRRGHCRLALAYLDKETFAVDWQRIAAEHPGLYAPLCASVVQHGAGRAALVSYSRNDLQRISRRACKQALRVGVVSCGSTGFGDARVKQRAWKRIFAGQAKQAKRA